MMILLLVLLLQLLALAAAGIAGSVQQQLQGEYGEVLTSYIRNDTSPPHICILQRVATLTPRSRIASVTRLYLVLAWPALEKSPQ